MKRACAVFMAAVVAVGATSAGALVRAAGSCPGATLYSVAAGDESSKADWYLAGVAGSPGNGWAYTDWVSVFNPDSAQQIHVEVNEYSEVFTLAQQGQLYNFGFDLPPARSITLKFDASAQWWDPQRLSPTGKVHFHIRGSHSSSDLTPAAANVYAEQYAVC